MSIEHAKAWELLDAGDVREAVRHLRFTAEKLEIGELARIVERVSAMTGSGDLETASAALAAAPGEPRALYDFGYACVEQGAAYLAVPALSAALRRMPDSTPILTELVVAPPRSPAPTPNPTRETARPRRTRARPWPPSRPPSPPNG